MTQREGGKRKWKWMISLPVLTLAPLCLHPIIDPPRASTKKLTMKSCLAGALGSSLISSSLKVLRLPRRSLRWFRLLMGRAPGGTEEDRGVPALPTPLPPQEERSCSGGGRGAPPPPPPPPLLPPSTWCGGCDCCCRGCVRGEDGFELTPVPSAGNPAPTTLPLAAAAALLPSCSAAAAAALLPLLLPLISSTGATMVAV